MTGMGGVQRSACIDRCQVRLYKVVTRFLPHDLRGVRRPSARKPLHNRRQPRGLCPGSAHDVAFGAFKRSYLVLTNKHNKGLVIFVVKTPLFPPFALGKCPDPRRPPRTHRPRAIFQELGGQGERTCEMVLGRRRSLFPSRAPSGASQPHHQTASRTTALQRNTVFPQHTTNLGDTQTNLNTSVVKTGRRIL